MQRIATYGRTLIAVMLVSVTASTACADLKDFFHKMHVDLYRNNAWPDPFNELDAMHVVAPFEVMKNNGWRLNNTIGNNLFREGDVALKAAGNNRVAWIASQAPANRKVVYVLRGRSDKETQQRMASVRETLASTHNGHNVQVLVTQREPTYSSGAWATQINRAWLEGLPEPKLPSTSAAGTAGSAQQ